MVKAYGSVIRMCWSAIINSNGRWVPRRNVHAPQWIVARQPGGHERESGLSKRPGGSQAQSGAGEILRSSLDMDVARAHFLKTCSNRVDCTFRLIAIAAQMAEIQMA